MVSKKDKIRCTGKFKNGKPCTYYLPCRVHSDELTPQQERFVQNVVSGMNQTEAYRDAYPESSEEAATAHASRMVTNGNISEEIKKRQKLAATLANIKEAEVLGEMTRIAFASLRDTLSDDGYFDIQKACKNGSVDLIKKISRKQSKFGEDISWEFYSKSDALKTLGEWLGMKTKEKENPDTINKLVDEIKIYLEENPELDKDEVVKVFATRANLDIQTVSNLVN